MWFAKQLEYSWNGMSSFLCSNINENNKTNGNNYCSSMCIVHCTKVKTHIAFFPHKHLFNSWCSSQIFIINQEESARRHTNTNKTTIRWWTALLLAMRMPMMRISTIVQILWCLAEKVLNTTQIQIDSSAAMIREDVRRRKKYFGQARIPSGNKTKQNNETYETAIKRVYLENQNLTKATLGKVYGVARERHLKMSRNFKRAFTLNTTKWSGMENSIRRLKCSSIVSYLCSLPSSVDLPETMPDRWTQCSKISQKLQSHPLFYR